jgi:hypothetical protein
MSSNELIAEILALSSGLDSFSNFQILNIDQSNSLFSVAPELAQFVSSCGSDLNQLLSLSESSIFNQLIETNIDLAGSLSPCLEQLLGLEQLFSSGNDNVQLSNSSDVNNNVNLNSTEVSNSTASVSSASSNSTAAVSSNSTAAQDSQAKDANKDKGKDKKKNGKRSEIVQRSDASKRQILGRLGLGLMVVVGAFAL